MLMARKEIVVALLGAGRAGQEHAKNLRSFPHVKVAVVCDPVRSAAQSAAESKTPTYYFRKGGWERDYYHFFMDRFGVAFREELMAFFDALFQQRKVSPDGVDAL
jgi:hypothetical protein